MFATTLYPIRMAMLILLGVLLVIYIMFHNLSFNQINDKFDHSIRD